MSSGAGPVRGPRHSRPICLYTALNGAPAASLYSAVAVSQYTVLCRSASVCVRVWVGEVGGRRTGVGSADSVSRPGGGGRRVTAGWYRCRRAVPREVRCSGHRHCPVTALRLPLYRPLLYRPPDITPPGEYSLRAATLN